MGGCSPGVGRYREQLIISEIHTRAAAETRDAEALKRVVDELRTLNQNWLDKQTAAADMLTQRADRLGDHEAVRVSDSHERLFSQPWAYLARAHVKRRFDGPVDGVLQDLDAAERGIAATGQLAHRPFVHLERGETERASELFRAMGATRRAAALHVVG